MKKEIRIIRNLAEFEKDINRDPKPYDINMMVMPGTLEDKHKSVDPEKGIPAMRRQFNLIYLLSDGIHDVHMGADYRWLKPNDLVIVPENFVYASPNVRNCTGYCIHFKTEFIQPLLKGALNDDFPFFDFEAEHIINVAQEETVRLREAFENIIREYHRFSPERDYILRNYIHILLLLVREIYPPHARIIKNEATRTMKITSQFKNLLQSRFLEWREVQQYAAALHITPKYLTESVKEHTGKTPRELINDVLLLESKVLLGSSDKSVTEIAHFLTFEDASHFSHFFKQHTGMTPTAFRQKG